MTTTIRGGSEGSNAGALELSSSYSFCRALAKQKAANFYYGMKLLPEPKRSAMYALYAYMRLVDDIADDDAHERTLMQRRQDLDRWEQWTRDAITSGTAPRAGSGGTGARIWPAFADMVRRCQVPLKIFEEMIAGQRQDLEPVAITTFDDLYRYCYRVASVVGIASLYVWGFEGGDETLELSAACGIAFQLTNVLRDLKEDSARGRCYLPADELARAGIDARDLASGCLGKMPAFIELMRFQIDRARSYYEKSAGLKSRIQRDARPTLLAMTAIYRGILEKIAADPAVVLQRRVRLSMMAKLLIGWCAMRAK